MLTLLSSAWRSNSISSKSLINKGSANCCPKALPLNQDEQLVDFCKDQLTQNLNFSRNDAITLILVNARSPHKTDFDSPIKWITLFKISNGGRASRVSVCEKQLVLFQVCSNGTLGPPYLGLYGHFTKLTAPPAWPLLECTRQFPVSALHIWPPCLPATHPWLPATWTPLMPKRLKTNYQ